ncbi:C-GCAxxG-C-C family protein [Planctomycetota bacterium]
MNTKVEQTVDNFKNGFNCTQAVLDTYCEQLGLDNETAFKIATGFGNGMRIGGVCGAVTAAFMILGLKHGNTDATDKESKKKTHAIIKDFTKKFETRNGSINCKELVGDKSGCVQLVRDAAEILEQIKPRRTVICDEKRKTFDR